MTCRTCRKAEMTTARENYRYDMSGLPNVTLANVEISRCPKCGDYSVAIPRMEELHRVMASAVIRKPAALTPAEIKFLRKFIGWSGVDFAKHMGTTPESVSRWESGKLAMSAAADRLLRLMVASVPQVQSYSLDLLTDITPKKTAKPLRVSMKLEKGGWKATAA